MGKICVVGSLNMDMVINSPKKPLMGETVMGYGFMTTAGGKGANQAVSAARLGADVTMIGAVGADTFGCELKENLAHNGVNITNIKTISDKPTGVAVIVVNEGDNFIVVDAGANSELNKRDVIEEVINESDIVVIQLEIPLDTVRHVIDIAKKSNIPILLNPAPAIWLDDELLKKVDIITPNENECEIITGIKINDINNAIEACECLINKGIKQVIVTLGSKGVVYNNGNKIIHKTVPRVKVIDTTAAGDSFTAAVATFLSNGKDINEAVNFGNKVGTITVTRKGAQQSLPYLNEII